MHAIGLAGAQSCASQLDDSLVPPRVVSRNMTKEDEAAGEQQLSFLKLCDLTLVKKAYALHFFLCVKTTWSLFLFFKLVDLRCVFL